MMTHATRDEAMAAAPADCRALVHVRLTTGGDAWICARCGVAALREVASRKTIPGIAAILGGEDYTRPVQDEPIHCGKCHAAVPADAYSQQEWSRWGGKAIRVTAYYCADCARLLRAVGAGEYSAMQERAGAVPAAEAATKED